MALRRVIVSALCFFALTCGTALAQAAPSLVSFDPGFLYANSEGIVDITLNGVHLTTPNENGDTFSNDVQLLARRNGKKFFDVSKDIKDWTSSRLDLEFDSTALDLQTPGTIDFVIKVKGVQSNIVSMDVRPYPSVPPAITSIGPDTFNENLPLQHQYLFRIYAKNTPDDLKVSINGEQLTFLAFADFADGVVDVYVPEDLRSKAGQFPVVISSRSGTSNAVMLHIRDPRLLAASPAVAAKARPSLAAKSPLASNASAAVSAAVAPSVAAIARPMPSPAIASGKNPFVGVTPVPAAALAQATIAPVALATAAPVAVVSTPPPFATDAQIAQRYRSMQAILLPSLRGALDPIVANEVSAIRGGPADPDAIAIGSLRTIRPKAAPAQLRVLEGYVLATALDALNRIGSAGEQRSQSEVDNRTKLYASLSNIMKKYSEMQDTIVQTLK